MAYKITISDATILEKSIESITFKVDPPPDDYYSMRTYPRNSMTITGTIGTEEKTIELYNWALLRSNDPNCYKEVVVEETKEDILVRKVTFSKAFVVDYNERFTSTTGVGHFTLLLRQRVDKDIKCTSDVVKKLPQEIPESPVTETLEELAPAPIPSMSAVSIGKRIKSEKEQILEKYAKEIQESKAAFKRAEEIGSQKKYKKKAIASNGKLTLSGFDSKTTKAPKEFTRVSLKEVMDYCNKIGHELPPPIPDILDNGIEGSFYACHAEKQLSLLTDKPIGVSKGMCQNCIEFFQKLLLSSRNPPFLANKNPPLLLCF